MVSVSLLALEQIPEITNELRKGKGSFQFRVLEVGPIASEPVMRQKIMVTMYGGVKPPTLWFGSEEEKTGAHR